MTIGVIRQQILYGNAFRTIFIYCFYRHIPHICFNPLDLSIFSPLKHAYQKRLGALALLNDLTSVKKQNFLNCYKLARINALTVTNYKQGWSALGLWPVRISKPLINRLLLENSNKLADKTLVTSEKILIPK
jgi:hypothetical protein